jgi:hypothetical protein
MPLHGSIIGVASQRRLIIDALLIKQVVGRYIAHRPFVSTCTYLSGRLLTMMQRALAALPRAARVISKRRDFSALVSLEEEFPGYVKRCDG